MSSFRGQVQKQVQQGRKTGFDREAYNRGTSQSREATDNATKRK